ncbi:MAG: ParB/RepB/Spo0J family partition protein [Candidatus Omnitrophota bacterium]
MVDIKLSQISLSGTNPRKRFNAEMFKELVDSVRKHGIIEPLIVRERKNIPNRFELVSGERRLKAAQELKFDVVPAIKKELNDVEVLEIQLIENIQRQDLSPVEEGRAFKALMAASKCTQEDVAQKIGKSQGYVAARVSLLDLPEDFLKLLEEDKLQAGHIKFMMNFKASPKILDNLKKRLKDHWKNADTITVREFQDLCLDVTSRQTKPLYKESYGGDMWPVFDLKVCEKCEHNKTVDLKWDKNKKRCFNPECWSQKQTTFKRAEAERVREKVKSGKVVKEADLPKNLQTLENCRFDKKTCAKCENRKIGIVKDWNNKSVKKEICLDKECYARKEKEALEAAENAKQEAFKKQVEKCKEKAAKGAMDREFVIELLVSKMGWDNHEAVTLAYGIKREILNNHKKAMEYFTRNTKVNVEEILRFVTYWKD